MFHLRCHRLLTLALIGAALSVADTAPAAEQCHGSAGAVVAYVQAVQDGRWEDARALWSPACLIEAERQSIAPTDTQGWWDAASPVVRFREELAADRATWTVDAQPDPNGGAVAKVKISGALGEATYEYAVVYEDGDWRLAGRLWEASRRWQVLETRYFRIRRPAGHAVDPGACELLDGFVEDAARSLGAGEAELAALAADPMPYLVADAATVEDLTGHATVGMVDVASGTIISSHFPHFHEVSHLLVGRVWPGLSVHTLPVLQEGLACLQGGRWGRAPAVVLHQGWVQLSWDTVVPSDLLTAAGFRGAAGGPDAAYAVAALICDTVVAEAGWRALAELYRSFSGTAEEMAAVTAQDLAIAIGQGCGWETGDPLAHLDEAVRARAERSRRCGIAPDRGGALGREEQTGINVGPDDWRVLVTGEVFPVALVWGDDEDGSSARFSSIFAEQLPGRTWDGRRWGVVCRPTGVSFYDFTANRLAGVWVADFTGEPPLDEDHPGNMRFLLEPPSPDVAGLVVYREGVRR